jgi:hypothetical protein
MEFATFYVGSGLSPYLRACLNSWSTFGHTIDVYTYDPQVPLPPGATRRDANEIMASSRVYTYRRGAGAGSVAAFANEFRYRLVQARPVVWVDTDVLCLRADWPEREYYLGWESPSRELCNNAIFGAPAGSELVARLLSFVEGADRRTLEFGDTGPRALTSVLRERGLEHLAAESTEFYPLHFTECRYFMDPALRAEAHRRIEGAYAMHLWDEIWTRQRIPTFLRPPVGSLLEEVLERHGVTIPVAAHFEDLDAMEFVVPEPHVAYADYVALSEWAHSLERSLQDLQATSAPEPPSERRRRRFLGG